MSTIPVGPIAPISRRAVACLIDLAIAGVVLVAGYAITAATALSARTPAALLTAMMIGLGIVALVQLAWFLVFSGMHGTGASLGMRIMKLHLVRADTEQPIGFGRALLRNIVFGLSASIIVGYFTPLFDGSGRYQGWHDRAAGALVRDARGAVPVAPDGAAATTPAPAPVTTAMPFIPMADEAFAPPQGPPLTRAAARAAEHDPAEFGSPTGHTLPHAPGSPAAASPALVASPMPAASAASPAFDTDPLDATVTSAAAQAARVAQEAESAMITVVPGISPSVPAPAPTPVSGPETTVAPAAAAPAAPTPVMQPLDDEGDLEETRISIPGHRLLFVWDDGARATVSGRTLFGRNPAAEAGAAVIAVRDETLSLSKTHFEAAAEASGGWVMDRHSTNGMTIVRDGVRIACPPGERVRIRLGDAIEIGERIVTVGGYA
ncbi:RDD family protein [Microbacterium panaciterrae]|uniref:RDD domain-containing protein n=1 Tax=Microbacterium panaciterrae TaxID=985759 RepID=A0ABP8P2H8_9MICO